jgi:hypothetical protein
MPVVSSAYFAMRIADHIRTVGTLTSQAAIIAR